MRKARGLVRILGERGDRLGVVPDPEIGAIQKALSALHKVERRVCTMSDLEECREHYGKGQIRARYMHRNGLLEGEALFYAENGQLIQRSSFKAGQLYGEMLIYDRDGRLIQRSYYHEGKLEGPVLRYDEEGFVIRRLSCKHDLVDGEAIVEAPEDESRPEKMRLGAHSGTLGQQA